MDVGRERFDQAFTNHRRTLAQKKRGKPERGNSAGRRPPPAPRTESGMSVRPFYLISLLCGFLLLMDPGSHANGLANPHHDLKIVLFPEAGRLSGVDAVTVPSGRAGALVFELARSGTVHSVEVDGTARPYTLQDGRLQVPVPDRKASAPCLIVINYTASFTDRPPETPANTDNPGYGVVGVISDAGLFLQAGSGWYPELPGTPATYDLSVDAPAGVVAVTAGRSLGHETKGNRTFSVWRVDQLLPSLALSAGRYVVREKMLGERITLATYFFQHDEHLSFRYLEAAAKFIKLYEQLIGPYPFAKFAVVENFFPTGYGFPSYTLLGSTVLRLPFIPDTSLGHEIAHCWWGNGVLVDAQGGNWCEGLTTYLSDHLYKEQVSEAEAREYRKQILRNFTLLVTPDQDLPLSTFHSRYNPASQAIGYGKAAMVFHMLRKKLGEGPFWEALRDVYRERLFQKVSWKDLQGAFERRGGYSLDAFFDQWLFRKGGPHLELTPIQRERAGAGWLVVGRLRQEEPVYALELKVAIETAEATREERVSLTREAVPLSMAVAGRPTQIAVDPDCDLFRVMTPSEIPPAINGLKGSSAVTVVLSQSAWPGMEKVAKVLVESLGLEKCRILPEAGLDEKTFGESDLLFVGLPSSGHLPAVLPAGVSLTRDGFVLEGQTFGDPSEAFFAVLSYPSGRLGAVFHPLSPRAAEEVAGKLTHYGRYSYLGFRAGKNEVKGIWPVTASPLVKTWE